MSDQPDDPRFIEAPRALGQKILEWRKLGYHVLSPAIQITAFAPGYGVNASLVLLDPTVDGAGRGTDVYFDKTQMKGSGQNDDAAEERALSKIGLLKIAAATGVSWVNPYGRVDPLTIQNLWIYNVTGVYLAYDGTPQVIKGEKEIDYRDESAQIGEWSRAAWDDLMRANAALPQGQRQTSINGWSDRRVRQARMNGAERAETGALERAIRTLGVKHAYTIGELRKPFVALRVCPLMDMTDPEVRRLVTAGMLGGVAKLYAQAAPGLPPPSPSARETIDVTPRREPEPVDAGPQQAEAPSAPVQRQTAAPVHAPVQNTAMAPAPARPREPGDDDMPDDWPDDRDVRGDEAEALSPGAVMIVKVYRETRKYGESHAKAGQTFTKWRAIDHNGIEYVTVFPRWGAVIDNADRNGVSVIIQAQPKTFRGMTENEILNVQPAGSARGQAPRGESAAVPEMKL